MHGAVSVNPTIGRKAPPHSRLQAANADIDQWSHAQSLHVQGGIWLLECGIRCAGDARADVWPSRGLVERGRGALHSPGGLPALL